MVNRRFESFVRVVVALASLGTLMFSAVGQASAATIIYVNASASGANNGTSWINAYKSLQTGLSHASSGKQIWVAKGTYKPGTARSSSFHLKNGVAVYGGFAGTETMLSQRNVKTNVTILSGEIGAAGVSDNTYHVVTASSTNSTAILDGFTITAGNANGGFLNDRGAGVYNYNASPTLRNLTISGNRGNMGAGMYNYQVGPTLVSVTFSGNHATSSDGGGMYLDGSNPKLTKVTFSNNTAFNYGGGLFGGGNPKLTDVTFTGNSAQYGGGMYNDSNPTMLRVTFVNNKASVNGGGMYNWSSTANLSTLTFIGNSAHTGGGGLFNNSGNPTISNSTFSGNTAPSGQGGGMFNGGSPSLTNLTLSGNSASSGGGMYNFNGNPTLLNVTLAGNSSSSGAAMYNEKNGALISDSVFWGNGSEEIHNYLSAPTVFNSIIKGGCPSGAVCNNVFNLNPKLGALQNNGGFTKTMALGAGSAAIDRGDSNCALKDQRGVKRPQGPKCDLGAYEVKVLTFYSQAANDGFVLETGKNSGHGGTVNSNGNQLLVGDDASNRQFRSFTSFNTASLPDGAAIISAKLWLEYYILVGTDPFTDHGSLLIDEAKPYFGAGLPLVASDFQASATVSPAGTVSSVPVSGWYIGTLNTSGRSNINKTGTTQLRLRYSIANDNDNTGDALEFYSGDALITDQPYLSVYYNP